MLKEIQILKLEMKNNRRDLHLFRHFNPKEPSFLLSNQKDALNYTKDILINYLTNQRNIREKLY